MSIKTSICISIHISVFVFMPVLAYNSITVLIHVIICVSVHISITL